jgi:hypothetical protein
MTRAARTTSTLTILWACVVANYVTHDELHRKPREPYTMEQRD